MNELFNSELGKLIDLQNTKIISKTNKKIISTCVFLPEKPSISNKTPLYITGLIKLVETFKKEMGSNWILRIYYDSMFDHGLKKKELEHLVKKETQDAEFRDRERERKTKKRSEEQNNLDNISSNSYEYQYNSIKPTKKSEPKYNDWGQKMINEEPETINNIIIKNKVFLKKILKMVKLYFDNIVKDKTDRYDNIELVSFNCNKASKNPDFIGHPATFGSIMRFLPLFDNDVDIFFCINGRYCITPLQKILINNWYNSDLQILALKYKIKTISNSIYQNLNKEGYNIKINCLEQGKVSKIDNLFIDFILNMYKYKFNLYKSDELNEEIQEKYSDFMKLKVDKQFQGLRLLGINIEDDFSIGAGFFGYKKTSPNSIIKSELFSKLLSYYIQSKNDFKFGIDELFIKIILCHEVGVEYDDEEYVYRKKRRRRGIKQSVNKKSLELYFLGNKIVIDNYIKIINKEVDRDINSILLENSNHKKIQLKKIIKNGLYTDEFFPESILNVITNDYYNEIQILNTRSLYELENGKLLKDDKIYKLIKEDKEYDELSITFKLLFDSYDENKRLFLVDSSKKNILINLFKLEPYLEKNIENTISPRTITDYKKYKTIGDFYTVIDINDFRQSKIMDLLNILIDYYRIERNHNIIKYIPKNYKYAYYFKEYNNLNNLRQLKSKKKLRNNLVNTKKRLRKIKKNKEK